MKIILAGIAALIVALAAVTAAFASTVSFSPDPKVITPNSTTWLDINVQHDGNDLSAVTFWFSHPASIQVLDTSIDSGFPTENWDLTYAGTVPGYPNTYYIAIVGNGFNCIPDNEFTAIRVEFQVGACGTGGALDWIEGANGTYFSTCLLQDVIPTYDDGYLAASACPPPCPGCQLDKPVDTWGLVKELYR